MLILIGQEQEQEQEQEHSKEAEMLLYIFRCDFNGVMQENPVQLTENQKSMRAALNVSIVQVHSCTAALPCDVPEINLKYLGPPFYSKV